MINKLLLWALCMKLAASAYGQTTYQKQIDFSGNDFPYSDLLASWTKGLGTYTRKNYRRNCN